VSGDTVDFAHRITSEVCDDVSEPGFGVDDVEFGGLNQGIHDGRSPGTAVVGAVAL
jgi:hypothetical protein